MVGCKLLKVGCYGFFGVFFKLPKSKIWLESVAGRKKELGGVATVSFDIVEIPWGFRRISGCFTDNLFRDIRSKKLNESYFLSGYVVFGIPNHHGCRYCA